MPDYKLTYFNVMGLGEQIRWLLHYVEQDFEDNRISFDKFTEMKSELPFRQVPLFEIGSQKLVQSRAITRFLATKHGLLPQDPWQAYQTEMIIDALFDCREGYFYHWKEENPAEKEKLKDKFLNETLPRHLPVFEKLLKDNKTGFLVGNAATWADIYVAYYLDCFVMRFGDSVLNDYPELKKLASKIKSHPRIKSYLENRKPLDRDI